MLAIYQQQQIAGRSPVAPVPPAPDVGYQPIVHQDPSPSGAGVFTRTPAGVILHGSRSGRPQSIQQEYDGTRSFARGGANGLGWNCTVGEDSVALHLTPLAWGWNARKASSKYLAVEFAQPTADYPITDAQVRAFCWWFEHVARAEWVNLREFFPTHAEVERRGETGMIDGKSDVFPFGDPRADELRDRIVSRLSGASPAVPTLGTYTRQQVIEIVKQTADEYEIPAVVLLALAIGESNLDPRARRPADSAKDRTYWPDVSGGLYQQTVRWSREYARLGYTSEYPGPAVVEQILQAYYDPWHAGRIAAPQLKYYLAKADGDHLAALSYYNKPSLDPSQNPNVSNYRRGLLEAARLLG